jgi:hypothetical protein
VVWLAGWRIELCDAWLFWPPALAFVGFSIFRRGSKAFPPRGCEPPAPTLIATRCEIPIDNVKERRSHRLMRATSDGLSKRTLREQCQVRKIRGLGFIGKIATSS